MQYVDSTWYLEDLYTQFQVGNPDGVGLTVQQVGDVGTLFYTSNDMPGTLDPSALTNTIRIKIEQMKSLVP
ncbi:MAG: hypothetical protein DRH97_07095 [Chloroflexi bacterium]|nr:MAG: hypothetical protein DRH97_07095 [Chloroflexota bacterium]